MAEEQKNAAGAGAGAEEDSVHVGGVIVEVNGAPLAREAAALTMEEQVTRAKKIYSGDAVQQVVTIFRKYDVNQVGVIEMQHLPRMCHDLGIKPWKALKELEPNSEGNIDLREFISWWFSPKTEHSRQEESYVHSIFDRYDANADGLLDQGELVKLAMDLGVKPWKAFQAIDFDADGQVSKRVFTRWWFASQSSEATAAPNVSTPRKSAPSPKSRVSPVKSGKAERIAAAMADLKRATAALEAALAE